MTNFFCLKWGLKYDYRYVNRLFNSLKIHYKHSFNFYCLTDDKTNIDNDIEIRPLPSTFAEYPRTQLFTSEKMCFFNDYKYLSGKKAWFDLDILIHNDITDLIEMDHYKPRLIMNYWRDPNAAIKNYGFMTTPLNSSFVAWQDSVGYNLYEDLVATKDKVFFSYPSLDKYIFYQIYRKDNVLLWPKHTVYNYNIGAQFPDDLIPTSYKADYKICLFNTSHKKWAKPNETFIELDQAQGWAKDIWESYER